MRSHKIAESLAYTLAALTAVVTGVLALRFPHADDAHSGPGSFPLFLAVALELMGLCGVAMTLRKEEPKNNPEELPTPPLRLPLMVGAAALYLLLMPVLGFISTTTMLCAVTLNILGYRNVVRAVAVGFITAFALYGIFGLLMNVLLPKGWIG